MLLRYILKRLLMIIPVLIGVTIIIFTILYFAPGDPVSMALGVDASPQAIEKYRVDMGLNGTYFERLFRYIGGVVHGDLGRSFVSGKPVLEEILLRVPNTVTLAVWGIIIASVLGITLGIISAVKQYSFWDTAVTAGALFGVSMPMFWQGLMMILVFAVFLGWFPASGFKGLEYKIMPITALGVQISAHIMRNTRSSMLEVLRQDYIRTARAKGQKESKVIFHHALKNALIPVVTVIGIDFGKMLAGSVIIETIFSIPGIGKYMIDAINARNYASVQGTVLVIAFAGCIINLGVDVLYTFIDPRLKTMFGAKKQRRKV